MELGTNQTMPGTGGPLIRRMIHLRIPNDDGLSVPTMSHVR